MFLPFVRTVWQETTKLILETFPRIYSSIDSCCHAMLTNEVTRFASMSQGYNLLFQMLSLSEALVYVYYVGKGFLRVVRECYSHKITPEILDALDNSNGHHAPLFGCICGLLGISLQLCERMYFRMLLRDLTSAAVRLNVLGPLEASQLQVEIASNIERILSLRVESASELEVTMIATAFNGLQFQDNIIPRQTAPIVDLLQAQHGLLYSRLFSS